MWPKTPESFDVWMTSVVQSYLAIINHHDLTSDLKLEADLILSDASEFAAAYFNLDPDWTNNAVSEMLTAESSLGGI